MCYRPKDYCAPYNGTVCEKYVGNRLVYYRGYGKSNDGIVLALLKEMVATFDEFCRPAAEKLLCHYAFPDCDTTEDIPAYLPLCK